MFGGGAVVGKFYDAYGPRYILLLGTFLHIFGIMMASISTEFYQFALSQGICSAIGASMIFYGAMSSVSTWFYKKRAFALGITASGSSLGGVIFPIMVRRLIVLVGFGWSMRITAFLMLFMMVFANLTVRSRLPPKGMTPWVLQEFVSPFKEPPYFFMVVGGFLFFFGYVSALPPSIQSSLANLPFEIECSFRSTTSRSTPNATGCQWTCPTTSSQSSTPPPSSGE